MAMEAGLGFPVGDLILRFPPPTSDQVESRVAKHNFASLIRRVARTIREVLALGTGLGLSGGTSSLRSVSTLSRFGSFSEASLRT